MTLNEIQLKKMLQQPLSQPVYYYYSTEPYLVSRYAALTLANLCENGEAEITRLEGPVPDIGEAVAAAGTISFFGTKRIVYLPQLDISGMKEPDVSALCDLCESLENAVLVITTIFPAEKLKDGVKRLAKKEKLLIETAEKTGVLAHLLKPQPQDLKRHLSEMAQDYRVVISPQAAAALLERCGTDLFTLEQELAKLAAVCGYTEITPQVISAMGTLNLEADVFELVRLVSGKNLNAAMKKLQTLLALQNEPIALAATLNASFLDMYRVKIGAQSGKSYAAVHKDFAYRGSDYRLKKALETGRAYSKIQLQTILKVLDDLDEKLKSSAAPSEVLLQTALCEIAIQGKTV